MRGNSEWLEGITIASELAKSGAHADPANGRARIGGHRAQVIAQSAGQIALKGCKRPQIDERGSREPARWMEAKGCLEHDYSRGIMPLQQQYQSARHPGGGVLGM